MKNFIRKTTRKAVGALFMVAGLIPSIMPSSANANVVNPAEEFEASLKAKSTSELQKTSDNFMYFSDIIDHQQQNNFVAAHYSHSSHGSHGSHRSHYSSRY